MFPGARSRGAFLFLAVLVLWVSAGCIRKVAQKSPSSLSPDQVVREFIEVSASAKSLPDKKRIQNLCMGELRRVFERMPEESFRVHYMESGIRVRGIRFLEVSTQSDKSHIRYQVEIENEDGVTPTHEINEREVELSQSQGSWYLESIKVKGSDKIAFIRGMIF